MIVKNIDDFKGLRAVNRMAVFLSVFLPRSKGIQELTELLYSGFPQVTVSSVASNVEDLRRQGLLCKPDRCYERFAFCTAWTLEALKAMKAEADTKNWWPTRALLQKAQHKGEHRYGGIRKDPPFELALTDGICLFLFGSAKDPDALKAALAGDRGRELARAVAMSVCKICAEEPDFAFANLADPRLRIMRYYLNAAFLMGRDVRKVMTALDRGMRTNLRMAEATSRMYAAICTWMGWRQGLDNPEVDAENPFVKACRLLFDGKVDAAAHQFRPLGGDRLQHDDRDYDNFPERLLQAMAWATAKPEKIGKTKPASLMKGRFDSRDVYRFGMYHEAASTYMALARRASEMFGGHWARILSGKAELLKDYPGQDEADILDALVLAWDWRMAVVGRAANAAKVGLVLDAAHRAADIGYLTLAGLYMTLTSGSYKKDDEQFYLAKIDAGAFRFMPSVEPEPEWKGVVRALKAVVKKATASVERGEAASRARLIWRVELEMTGPDGFTAEIEDIDAYLRHDGASETGEEDQRISRYDLDRKSIVRLMDDKDALIAKTLQNGYGWRDSAEIAKLLCGKTNVEQRFPGGYGRRGDVVEPVEFEQRRCELKTSVGEDGGMILKLPTWAIGHDADFAIRKVCEGTYAYIELTKEVRKFLTAFADYGDKGEIVLPQAAMAEAGPIVDDIAKILPIAAPTELEAMTLRHVEGEADCRMRLDFTGGTLTLKAVVYPIAENRAYFVEPGVGQPEKVVNSAAGAYLLVRSLEREKGALEAVRRTLSAAESWHNGKGEWRIDEIGEALDALAALKNAAPPVPMEWVDERRLKVSKAPKSGVALTSRRTAEDWFSVKGEFKLDDGRVLDLVQLIAAMADRAGNYVRLSDGDYVALTKEMARQLAALKAASRRKGDGLEIVKAAVPMLDGVFGEGEGSLELPDAMAKTADEIRAAFAASPDAPKTLRAELRPYQLDGYRWLSRLAGCGFGSCLADDMGLGKTIQVIALLLEKAKDGPSLVVAPSSVCGNWRSELRRFAPTLSPVMAFENEGRVAAAKAHEIVIVSYGYLLFHEDEFTSVDWNGVVLDEAQAIKNDASKRAKLVKRFKAKFRVAATGTPVENRLGELWSLFDFLNPGLLGPAASFAARFTDDGKAAPELKRLVKPLILRRLKGDVLDDLPEKTEITIPVELGTAERTAYEACRRHALATLAEQDGEANRMSILAELTRLRRFCCHPSLVLGSNEVPSAKLEALVGILEGLRLSGHRALVFSQFTDYLAIVRKMMTSHGWSHCYLDGATPTAERERLVNAFQSGEGDFFVISLKAGGTGLNLTSADYVILLDPWWNPAVENQAADRAHRIGQKNPVTVYRLIASDTVEERVLELHKEKKAIAEDVLDGTGKSALTPEVLMKLFG